MFIAFEGPDEVGKSTSAKALDYQGEPTYNVTKALHDGWQNQDLGEVTHTYDRIDWLTHMVYRLAMPEWDWNDDRPRTVFAMPDTHLVLKMHHPTRVVEIDAVGEGYAPGRIQEVNEMYFHQIDFLARINRAKGYQLFKSVSIVEVWNDKANGVFEQRMISHDSAPFGTYESVGMRIVYSEETLLEFLQHVEHQHI